MPTFFEYKIERLQSDNAIMSYLVNNWDVNIFIQVIEEFSGAAIAPTWFGPALPAALDVAL